MQQAPQPLLRQIESVFVSYAAAFSRGDQHAIAAHFGDTVHVTADTGTGVHTTFFASRDEWLAVISELVASYGRKGVGRVQLQRLHVMSLSERVAQASVRWALVGRGGADLYEFEALYTLANEGGAWRIVAIAHDEVASRHSHASTTITP